MKSFLFMPRLLLALLAWVVAVPAARSADRPPNLIFILVDDQGYYDLGCYGATEVETPRIDALAREGIRFTDYYAAAPICSPSRAGILTGCYPRRVGLQTWVQRADSEIGIHPGELTLAELLKSNDYATACIGKWHVGFKPPFLPRNQGFDYYFGLLHNLDPVEVVYFEKEGGVPLLRNNQVVKRPADPAELTRLYTDEAIRFIARNKDKPFFLYLPHTMLHNPLGVSPEFQGKSKFGEYGDAIQEMDFHVGRLMDALKANGVADNTFVVYASDNGRGPGRTPAQPIQGHKLTTFEGGIRVPCIAWGPSLGIRSGVESDTIVRAMDWYPTFATLAGVKVPEDRVIDGRDLTPLLQGKSGRVPPPSEKLSLNAEVPLRRTWNQPLEWSQEFTREEYNDAFFYHGSQGALAAVRLEQWKLYLNPTPTLYDMTADPGETKPVRIGSIIRKLRGMAVMFEEEMSRDARPAGRVGPPVQTTPPELESHMNLTYARYGDRALELDLYRPVVAEGPLPAIVCVHGGGWFQGNRESHGKLARELAARGFVTVTITYRLSGEAPFPAAIHDCKAAVRWLRANAETYGINPDKIGAIGLSAGGHLVALLGTSGGVTELEGDGGNPGYSSAVQAVVPMGAQTDFESDRNRENSKTERGQIWRQFLGGSLDEQPAAYKLASPLTHLDANDPPMIFMCGENDDPSTHADVFRARMKELGIPAGLTIVAGAPHAFIGKPDGLNQAVQIATGFFERELKR